MLGIKIALYIAMIGYLLRQAAMDAKTGLVIKKYNDVSLIVSFIGMLIVLFTNKISIFLVVEVFFVGVVLILISSNLVPKCLKSCRELMQRHLLQFIFLHLLYLVWI